MTLSKMNTLNQPVVKTDWIHACIEAQRLLDWRKFLLFDRVPANQRRIDLPKECEQKTIMTSDSSLDLNNPHIKSLVCTAPGFIEKFFSSSRLHHLSTWKADLSDFVRSEMQRLNKTYKRNDQNSIIMHVDMDCFFASVVLRQSPHLKNKPVVIAHSLQSSHQDFPS